MTRLPLRHQGIKPLTISRCFNITTKCAANACWSNAMLKQHYGPELILSF